MSRLSLWIHTRGYDVLLGGHVMTVDVALVSILYGLTLLSPWSDLSFPAVRQMGSVAPIVVWGIAFTILGATRIVAVAQRHVAIGIAALCLLTPLWIFVTVIAVNSRAPVLAIYVYILIKILWSLLNWGTHA